MFRKIPMWTVLVPPCLYAALVVTFRSMSLQGMLQYRTTYNVLLASYSMVTAVVAAHKLSEHATLHESLCAMRSPDPLYEWLWYGSKYVEWLDTAFLIAAGKTVSWLHWNHHASTPVLVGVHLFGRHGRTSIFDWPTFMNSVVHSAMYSYYAFPRALGGIRQTITIVQILQHVTALAFIVYTSVVEDCDVSVFANTLSLACYTMYLVQFCRFYLRRYRAF